MADEYCSDRKLHDLLAKHGNVDICDGIFDAVREFSHDSGINEIGSRKEVIDRNGSQFTWRRNVELQQAKKIGWKHFCVGTQQWDEDAMQWIKKQALAYQGHVLKYYKALCDISFSDYF